MSKPDENDTDEGVQTPVAGDPLGGTGGDIGGGPTGDIRNSPGIVEGNTLPLPVIATAAASFLVGLLVGWALWK